MISQFAQAALNLQVPLHYHFAVGRTHPGPTEHQIAACAYLIWEQEGRPEGRDTSHWEQARAQLIACLEHDQWLSNWQSFLVAFPSAGSHELVNS